MVLEDTLNLGLEVTTIARQVWAAWRVFRLILQFPHVPCCGTFIYAGRGLYGLEGMTVSATAINVCALNMCVHLCRKERYLPQEKSLIAPNNIINIHEPMHTNPDMLGKWVN